jgi:hypothetical protein
MKFKDLIEEELGTLGLEDLTALKTNMDNFSKSLKKTMKKVQKEQPATEAPPVAEEPPVAEPTTAQQIQSNAGVSTGAEAP